MDIKDIKLGGGTVTEVKHQGKTRKDGTIEGDQFEGFASFLQDLHKKTCADIPELSLSWERGVEKHHFKVSDQDFKADSFETARVQAAAFITKHLPAVGSKLTGTVAKFEQNPQSYTLDNILADVSNELGVLDCAGATLKHMADEL